MHLPGTARSSRSREPLRRGASRAVPWTPSGAAGGLRSYALRIATAALLALLPLATPGGVTAAPSASLPPTLSIETDAGGAIAVQDGIAVPTFDAQPRPRFDLDGAWRVERDALDTNLSLTDRSRSLAAIEASASGRQDAAFDDGSWQTVEVPGTLDPAPAGTVSGAWYRRTFTLPSDWQDRPVTLKFGAVNYVADVWLNGHYLGYHEGGHTPFAFPVEHQLVSGGANVLAVRVDVPQWGSRNDIVPWGLADWWEYGGITQSVWLEASAPLTAARLDVVPHLDGADVSVVVENRTAAQSAGDVTLEILPATLDAGNLLDPDPRALVAPGAAPIVTQPLGHADLAGGKRMRLEASFAIDAPDLWSLGRPALYVAHAVVRSGDGRTDQLYETFGLRRILVDPQRPRVLLNGQPVMFAGVAIHPERIEPTLAGTAGTGVPLTSSVGALAQLQQARRVSANLIRTGHTPALPAMLMLADRLGFGVWEEIPLYHFTPLTFGIAMGRGIAQQMLREMALRDMNHPSVLFYGLANESTGGQERTDALAALNRDVKAIDPTRLTGQAAYGSDPTDPTSSPLDVAGFTFYYGVFYGSDASTGTRRALEEAHRTYPKKPLMILEFGRWGDPPDGEAAQVSILQKTGAELVARRDDQAGGYVGAMVWWALDDYYTMRPGITVERFGMFRPDGAARPVAAAAQNLFAAAPQADAVPPVGKTTTGGTGHAVTAGQPASRLGLLLAYAVAVPVVLLGLLLLGLAVLARRRQRQAGRSA